MMRTPAPYIVDIANGGGQLIGLVEEALWAAVKGGISLVAGRSERPGLRSSGVCGPCTKESLLADLPGHFHKLRGDNFCSTRLLSRANISTPDLPPVLSTWVRERKRPPGGRGSRMAATEWATSAPRARTSTAAQSESRRSTCSSRALLRETRVETSRKQRHSRRLRRRKLELNRIGTGLPTLE